MMRHFKVPKERIGVLIGPDGKTKAQMERRLGVELLIDSRRGEVEVDDRKSEDPLALLKAGNVVRAIARGFAPQVAMKLVSDDMYLTVLDIHDFAGKSKSHVRRVTARIVGTEGKTRRHIEELTGANISVYGHTVAVIGPLEGHDVAREACAMLLSGSEHASVYKFLEAKRRAAKMAEYGF
jgi:ribosomal RNA assembly protein